MTAAEVLRARADRAAKSMVGCTLIYPAELRALADLVEAERAFAARAPDSSFSEYQRLTTALKLAGDNVERAFKEQGNAAALVADKGR